MDKLFLEKGFIEYVEEKIKLLNENLVLRTLE
jgi:hypothetical protein